MAEEKDEKKETKKAAKAEEKVEEKTSSSVQKDENKKEETDEKTEVPKKFKELVEKIENLSVLELSELVKVLEERFGVSAAAPVAAAPAAAPAEGGEGSGSEEKSEYNIELKDAGEKKIDVIKAVRTITEKGLKEAKELVDGAGSEPQVVKESVPVEEAKEAKKKLEEAGATVELK